MMSIIRNTVKRRVDLKQKSLDRILDAGARRMRTEGLDRAAIVPVMQDAGLTHGAFYSHFSRKDDLAVAAFVHAITTGDHAGPKHPAKRPGAKDSSAWPSAI